MNSRQKGAAVDFISEMTFDVKDGMARDFQEWIREHEDTLRKEAPPGWDYIGTYTVVYGPRPGECRQLWRHSSYGALDTFTEALGKGGPFAEAMDEMLRRFQDQDRDAARGQFVYKSVADVTIWGEE